MDIDLRNKILTVVLGIIILVLAYWLYDSLTTPYQQVLAKQAETEQVRNRMLSVRDALVQYEIKHKKFPPTEGGLDTLINYIKTDSMMISIGDSLFGKSFPAGFVPESLIYSPRPPHNKFIYTLNDTIRPVLYLLEDPGSDDKVGSLDRTTMRNAPNWN